jgi:glycosyltransferase involved in cell wall biosynthesis
MCRALQDRGVNVSIATTDDGIANGTNGTHSYGVATHIFPVTVSHSFKYSRALTTWLNSNVTQFDAVHIHAVFNHACVAAARVCQKQGVPYVVRPLGTLDPWSMQQSAVRKKLFWQLLGKKMLDQASAVHYTSVGELSATEPSLRLSRGQVIPLGLDIEETLDMTSMRCESNNDQYVLVLSRLHAKKGLDVLIEAFINLIEQPSFSSWRLLIAGEGDAEYVNKLKRMVASGNANESIMFLGWLSGPEKQKILKDAALLALPSHQENFGLCVVEALANGVPVLVSPHVNLSDDIKAASAGWVSEVNASALEACLAQALSDDDELLKRGHAGKTFAQRFRWSNIAEDLEQLYSTIVSPR